MSLLIGSSVPSPARRLRSWAPIPAGAACAAIMTGAAAGLLFAWPPGGSAGVGLAGPTVVEILVHNLGLAAVLVLGSPLLAWPVVVVNCFFLGFVVQAGASAHGWPDTLRLTVVHVPLEVGAWVLTLWCSVLLRDCAVEAWRSRQRPDRSRLLQLRRAALVVPALYLVAAGAEWLELWLVIREGNPA